MAKHGNRSASGNSGSAEVLTELGVDIEARPEVLRRCLVELGITFLYAPRFHPALRFAATVRKLLPFRTLFNMIGPLANPARPAYQLIGVPDPRQADLMARAIARLGVVRAAVVTGHDGLDEVSLDGPTRACWVESGRVSEIKTWMPVEFGLAAVRAEDLRVSGPVRERREAPGPLRREARAGSRFRSSPTPPRRSSSPVGSETLGEGRQDRGRGDRRVDSRRALLDRWAKASRGVS